MGTTFWITIYIVSDKTGYPYHDTGVKQIGAINKLETAEP